MLLFQKPWFFNQIFKRRFAGNFRSATAPPFPFRLTAKQLLRLRSCARVRKALHIFFPPFGHNLLKYEIRTTMVKSSQSLQTLEKHNIW